jgi:hypothetical protein
MKQLRCLVFVALLLAMSLGTRVSTRSSAAPLQNPIEPACLQFRQIQQFECFSGAQNNRDQKRCLAEYRHCIAQCGKH